MSRSGYQLSAFGALNLLRPSGQHKRPYTRAVHLRSTPRTKHSADTQARMVTRRKRQASSRPGAAILVCVRGLYGIHRVACHKVQLGATVVQSNDATAAHDGDLLLHWCFYGCCEQYIASWMRPRRRPSHVHIGAGPMAPDFDPVRVRYAYVTCPAY